MARQFNYSCTSCGRKATRDTLTTKVVSFKETGLGGKVIRSRNQAWLCKNCLSADPTYNSPERGFIDEVAVDAQTENAPTSQAEAEPYTDREALRLENQLS